MNVPVQPPATPAQTSAKPLEATAVRAAAQAPSRRLAAARSIEDLRRLARRRLPRAVFDFFDGGAEDETTLRGNRAAFERVRLMPRVLIDVEKVDTGVTIFGKPSALPICVAPTGAAGFGWPRGDVCIARAAAAAGIPYSLSTSATSSIERIAREAGGRLWFQAYILKKREFTYAMIERARVADYEALMITVDLPVGGKRERDFRNDFSVPFRYTRRNVFDFASRPEWVFRTLRNGFPVLENLTGFTPEATSATAVASSVGRNYDASFDWDDLKAMRDRWPRKLIVKGVVRPEDAEKLVAIGCDAVVVSNHGGRQLDGGIASLEALPGVAAAVGNRITVLVDGGVRRGVDVLRALALGARAVLIGRPTLFGMCAGGEPGATRALDILRDEFVRAMQLCGVRNTGEIGADLLVAPPQAGGSSSAVTAGRGDG